jgi:4-hydroxy-2-oxoheptanedioate aldolase
VFQVESIEAVEAADDLAAIDGVDVLFVGPADLSHAMGIPGQVTHPDFTAALDRVIAATERHGKAAGILLRDGASVAASHGRGFRFLGVGSDVAFVIAGARRELDAAREALAAG